MALSHLQEIRSELFDTIEGLSDQQLNEIPAFGGWSIAQVLFHVHQVEMYFITLAQQALEGASEAVGDIDLSKVPDRTLKAKSPIDPPTEPKSREELVSRLNHSRGKVIAFLNGTDPALLSEKSAKHPVFGRLNLKQTMEFIGGHEKRHIGQIEEIKKSLIAI
ncbi:DinB family protein [Bacillus sp. FJAT-27251]|uniref:DinB family protein n=1 Tax=Bacillus sp. FJAT-27251 TaxID=1684142 RepID=UPI0006A7E8B8|nr:DinB family protein [Bacillus sp. FJAT-27251]